MSKNYERMTFTMNKELAQQLREYCTINDIPLSSVVRKGVNLVINQQDSSKVKPNV